ncbi:MAG: hypothetical protein GF398_20290 [Chitinivibrionales bacterium]|nr:hypothetical protein [Chitinivibrionales bacterium]
MKRSFSFLAVVLFSASLFTAHGAADKGIIGVSVESNLMAMMSTFSFGSADYVSTAPFAGIGLRVAPSEMLGFDASLGLLIVSGVEEDSASFTDEEPSEFALVFSVGATIIPIEGDDADMGIYAKFNGVVQKIAFDPNFDEDIVTDSRFTPTISLGVEPAYYFTESFSIFFRTGLAMSFIPKTKYLGSNSSGTKDEVKEMEDNKISFGTDGLSIGLRYYIGG